MVVAAAYYYCCYFVTSDRLMVYFYHFALWFWSAGDSITTSASDSAGDSITTDPLCLFVLSSCLFAASALLTILCFSALLRFLAWYSVPAALLLCLVLCTGCIADYSSLCWGFYHNSPVEAGLSSWHMSRLNQSLSLDRGSTSVPGTITRPIAKN